MCEKVCKSKQGFSRYQNAKHRENQPEEVSITSKDLSAEDRLHPLYFNKYINECAKQLASDGCYSDEIINTFSSHYCSLDDANFTYQFVRDVIQSFNGNGEIFFGVEKYFRAIVANQKRKIDVKCMALRLMKYSSILSHYTTLTNLASEELDKEISLNLLESMITLYLRARTFKYVYHLKKEAFKIESAKKKMKSLRTSIKQATKKLELGH